MATIVQPYNPWRENLAVTILGNVLGDLWSQHRQNEQNKKANAFRGQLMQDIQAQTAAQAPVSLSQQNLPEGYNSDGWTTSFHKTYTPLTAFDFGTAGIGGSTRLPTADEVQRLGTNLASTPRFAMLNPDTIQGFISQITQQNEQQRLKDLQNEAISHFMNAGSFDDKINALTSGMINGAVPADSLKHFADYAKWRNQPFTFSSLNAGDRIYPLINNPNTGEITVHSAFPIGVPPEALLRAQTQRDIADQNNATQRYVSDNDNATRRYGYDVKKDEVMYERQHPKYTTIQDTDGNYYGYNNIDNTASPVRTTDGQQVRGTPKTKELTRSEELKYRSLENELKDLQKKQNAALQVFNTSASLLDEDQPLTPYLQELHKTIQQYEKKIASVSASMEAILNGKSSPKEPSSSQSQDVAPTVLGAKETSQPQSQAQPQTQTTASPATSVPIVLGPFGQDIRPVIPTQNDTVPTDLSGNISDDVQVARSNALSADVKPNAPSQPPKVNISPKDIPAEMLYNPERDKDIKEDNILTHDELEKIIAKIMAKHPQETAGVSPLLIAKQLFKFKGVRIKD